MFERLIKVKAGRDCFKIYGTSFFLENGRNQGCDLNFHAGDL